MACGCCSRGYETHSGNEGESDHENSDALEASQPPTRKGEGSTSMKKRVELDASGQPFGSMKAVLCADIKKYAKDLDPTTGWEGQPRHERKRLFKRLYTGMLCTPTLGMHVCRKIVMFRMFLLFSQSRLDMCNSMHANPDIHGSVTVDMYLCQFVILVISHCNVGGS